MVLMRAVYDVVLVETVGVGQSETDISMAADTVVFCVQPGSGDALQFRNLSLQDENGNIPMDGLLKAMARVRPIPVAGGLANLQSLLPIAGISRTGWTWLGPGNIGGRIRSIAINPITPSTMFAGSVGGGIFKTTNTGGSWLPVDDFMANLAVSSLVFNPASPNTMVQVGEP